MKKIVEIVSELAAPVAEKNGCELWDVEYIKEAGNWFLRIFIDREDGVSISHCEAVSRELGDLLDEADPIAEPYTFEVCSAGLERPLRRQSDFERYMGNKVAVHLYKSLNNRKEFVGILSGYDADAVTIKVGEETLRFEKNQVSLVRLRADF